MAVLTPFPKCFCHAIGSGDAAASPRRTACGFGVFWTVLLMGLLFSPSRGEAEPLPKPTGEVVLTITGAIENTNAPGEARFDLAMLEALPSHTVVTLTPWSKEELTFTGPLARDVMKLVDPTGDTVTAVALNDYKSKIPLSDFEDYDVIIALKLNGEYMRIRDKGPLWIAYPLDQNPGIAESASPKMVWQLSRLQIE
jgi:hypothetical protein